MANISRSKRFSKTAKDSVFGAAIAASIVDPSKLQNAIDFIEGPGGIGIVLRPVQRVVVKAIYGVPFDYKPEWASRIPGWGMVPMWDVFREKKLHADVTEEEYLQIAYEEQRCNIKDWREIPNMGGTPGEAGFNEACIFAGRRGGKSELVAAIAAYKLYLLLNIRSPQEHFGLVSGSNIDFTFLAQDEKGAGRLFKKLREQVNRASWFGPFLKDNNTKDLSFVSLADRDQRDINPTIQVSCLPCLDEHELVWKKGGLAEIGDDVQVGDTVLDVFANGQRVTHKQYNEKEVWALETANFRGDPLLLTPNHTCLLVPASEAAAKLPYLKCRSNHVKGTNCSCPPTIDGRLKRRLGNTDYQIELKQEAAEKVGFGDYLLFPRIPEVVRLARLPNVLSEATSTVSVAHYGARAIPAPAIN